MAREKETVAMIDWHDFKVGSAAKFGLGGEVWGSGCSVQSLGFKV